MPDLSGSTVDSMVVLALLAAVALAGFGVLRGRPTALLVLYCGVSGFVPFWFGYAGRVNLQPLTAVGVLVLACIIGRVRPRLGTADVLAGAFFLACLLPGLVGLTELVPTFVALGDWGVAFCVGRLLPLVVPLARVHLVVGITAALVGACATFEFVTGINPFSEIPIGNALYTKWHNLQDRGGIVRAEWAYGHSIALGACLALALPLLLAAPLRWTVRLVLLVPVMMGAVVSFSRIGMVCTLGGILLSVLFLADDLPRRLRVAVSAAVVAGGVAVAPFVLSTFTEAGTEASGSATYRSFLVSLIPQIDALGTSTAAQRTGSGELFFGRFQSIDNAALLLGLTYGWLAVVFAALLLVGTGLLVLRRRGSPAAIAVVCQLPAFISVAFITQYGAFFFFIAGLALCCASEKLALTGGGDGETPGSSADDGSSRRTLRAVPSAVPSRQIWRTPHPWT